MITEDDEDCVTSVVRASIDTLIFNGDADGMRELFYKVTTQRDRLKEENSRQKAALKALKEKHSKYRVNPRLCREDFEVMPCSTLRLIDEALSAEMIGLSSDDEAKKANHIFGVGADLCPGCNEELR